MKHLKPKILRFESLPSTNTELARLASEGAAEGLSIVADEQTAGRGRLQRAWSSPKGAGLYFSILLQPTIAADQWPLITFVAALAVGDALSETCDVRTDIKWPNDLLSGERKICGILAETVETPSGRAVIVGIGINLTAAAYPAELSAMAISVAEAVGRAPERESLLAALLRALSRWYSLLHEVDGPRKVVAAWTTCSTYASGKAVQVANGEDVWQGITRGVERDGALRLETTDGVKIVRAGDVSRIRVLNRG